jgi:hypothetical protein
MKVTTLTVRSALAVFIGGCFILSPLLAVGAGSNLALPAVIEGGFESWTKGGAVEVIFSAWQKGGLMEGSNKAAVQARYFRNLSQALGNYKSRELLESKGIGRASQVIYLSINFERGAVYGRFLVYRTEKDWVVQNMDFNDRPEAIMPWLAFEGERTE